MRYEDSEERCHFWRLRAEELRATASQFKERIARKGLLDAADAYDRLADESMQRQAIAESRLETTQQRKGRKAARRRRS